MVWFVQLLKCLFRAEENCDTLHLTVQQCLLTQQVSKKSAITVVIVLQSAVCCSTVIWFYSIGLSYIDCTQEDGYCYNLNEVPQLYILV
jgi:hypothetical protein